MQTIPQTLFSAQVPGSKSYTSLSDVFRLLDDISPRQATAIASTLGGDPGRVLESGYGSPTKQFVDSLNRALNRSVSVRRDSIIFPVRDAEGRIVALHDQRMQWLTDPLPHVANSTRAKFSEIRLCETTSEADSIALAENVCAIARNGCHDLMVQAAVLSARRAIHPYNPRTLKRGRTHSQGAIAA